MDYIKQCIQKHAVLFCVYVVARLPSDSSSNILITLEIAYSHQDCLQDLLSCVVLVIVWVIKYEEIKFICFKDMLSFTWAQCWKEGFGEGGCGGTQGCILLWWWGQGKPKQVTYVCLILIFCLHLWGREDFRMMIINTFMIKYQHCNTFFVLLNLLYHLQTHSMYSM